MQQHRAASFVILCYVCLSGWVLEAASEQGTSLLSSPGSSRLLFHKGLYCKDLTPTDLTLTIPNPSFSINDYSR